MIQIALNVLWFLIGVVILAGIVWIALYVIRVTLGIPIPARVEQMIWVVVLLLVLIGLLTAIVGGGAPRFPWLKGERGGAPAAISQAAAGHLPRLLM